MGEKLYYEKKCQMERYPYAPGSVSYIQRLQRGFKICIGEGIVSLEFIFFYGLDVLILGIYALIWQQVIKKFELSVAYANKAVTLIWALVWGILIFHEKITVFKVAGILLVMAGIFILNSEEGKES